MAVTDSSLRAAWSSSVGRGTIGIRRPTASPRPNETPLRKPVKDPGPVTTATLEIVLEAAIVRSCAINSGSRPDLNVSDIFPVSSIVPIIAIGDEVSMTKITLRPHQAARPAEMLELDQSGAGRFEPVPPFHHHGPLHEQLVKAEVP